jgi:hypothetical protein
MVPSNGHSGHLADHRLGTLSTEITRIQSMEEIIRYFELGSTPTPRLGTMNKQVHPILRRIDSSKSEKGISPIFTFCSSVVVHVREEWAPIPSVSQSTPANFHFHKVDLVEPMISTAPTP